jgi:type I restriction enzyme M protein
VGRDRKEGEKGGISDLFSLGVESLEDSHNLPASHVLAQEIVEDLESALEQFREIASDLNAKNSGEVPRQ